VIVSGLPRSGTSLMMQMLAAGGLPLLTDGVRAADADNPRGYLEWEPIRGVAHRPEPLEEARGRAVKVVSALLPALPARHRYRVIWMERAAAEVEASQRAMLAHRAGAAVAAADPVSAGDLARHAQGLLRWLAEQPNFETCVVAHRELLGHPAAVAARVAAFLDLPLDASAMAAVVEPALWRVRS
jgi:hypothetical protein